ncbi:MAG: REP-associated tyrosine transposase [Thermoanaerobaculia bacterium]
MARPLRVEYPGAVHHVMARGHERSPIFRGDRDRNRFLQLLGTTVQDLGIQVHGYCLMDNHYHLLIETPEGGLSRAMKAIGGRYSQWFNWRHKRAGHLFEGRFKSVLVQKEKHLLELARYVVLNPVRAGLVKRPDDWRWSNYRATAGRGAAPPWLVVDWTLAQFARSRYTAREAYRRFVAAGKDSGEEIEKLEKKPYVGDRRFLRRVERILAGKPPVDEIPQRYRRAGEVNLRRIEQAVAREWRVTVEGLARSRGGDDKKAAIYLARKLTRLPGRQIGEAFGVKPARVSNVVKEIETNPPQALARRIDRLRQRLGRRS